MRPAADKNEKIPDKVTYRVDKRRVVQYTIPKYSENSSKGG